MPYSEIPVLEGFGLFDYKPTSRGAGNHVQVVQLTIPEPLATKTQEGVPADCWSDPVNVCSSSQVMGWHSWPPSLREVLVS